MQIGVLDHYLMYCSLFVYISIQDPDLDALHLEDDDPDYEPNFDVTAIL
jgi:hypothetical protein